MTAKPIFGRVIPGLTRTHDYAVTLVDAGVIADDLLSRENAYTVLDYHDDLIYCRDSDHHADRVEHGGSASKEDVETLRQNLLGAVDAALDDFGVGSV